uniref:SWI5-dependent HO expression protein 3 n=1 Tax=Rhabditophanes sp. KR3021 TaxID=114890 RepID=A0AC35UCB0_9BILA
MDDSSAFNENSPDMFINHEPIRKRIRSDENDSDVQFGSNAVVQSRGGRPNLFSTDKLNEARELQLHRTVKRLQDMSDANERKKAKLEEMLKNKEAELSATKSALEASNESLEKFKLKIEFDKEKMELKSANDYYAMALLKEISKSKKFENQLSNAKEFLVEKGLWTAENALKLAKRSGTEEVLARLTSEEVKKLCDAQFDTDVGFLSFGDDYQSETVATPGIVAVDSLLIQRGNMPEVAVNMMERLCNDRQETIKTLNNRIVKLEKKIKLEVDKNKELQTIKDHCKEIENSVEVWKTKYADLASDHAVIKAGVEEKIFERFANNGTFRNNDELMKKIINIQTENEILNGQRNVVQQLETGYVLHLRSNPLDDYHLGVQNRVESANEPEGTNYFESEEFLNDRSNSANMPEAVVRESMNYNPSSNNQNSQVPMIQNVQPQMNQNAHPQMNHITQGSSNWVYSNPSNPVLPPHLQGGMNHQSQMPINDNINVPQYNPDPSVLMQQSQPSTQANYNQQQMGRRDTYNPQFMDVQNEYNQAEILSSFSQPISRQDQFIHQQHQFTDEPQADLAAGDYEQIDSIEDVESGEDEVSEENETSGEVVSSKFVYVSPDEQSDSSSSSEDSGMDSVVPSVIAQPTVVTKKPLAQREVANPAQGDGQAGSSRQEAAKPDHDGAHVGPPRLVANPTQGDVQSSPPPPAKFVPVSTTVQTAKAPLKQRSTSEIPLFQTNPEDSEILTIDESISNGNDSSVFITDPLRTSLSRKRKNRDDDFRLSDDSDCL